MNSFGRGFGINMTPVVKNLVIINVVMFVATLLAYRLYSVDLGKYLGLYFLGSEKFMPYQFVTHMFMHGGIGHIFFNMYALVIFGNVLEQTWGGKRFLIYYLVTALGAALLHTLVNYLHIKTLASAIPPEIIDVFKSQGINGLTDNLLNQYQFSISKLTDYVELYYTPTIGASGAVFGVLLAFGMLFPNVRLQMIFPPVSLKAKHLVIGYGVLELYLGLTQPGSNIAHFAHLGGMLFGFILIKIYKKNQFNQNRWN